MPEVVGEIKAAVEAADKVVDIGGKAANIAEDILDRKQARTIRNNEAKVVLAGDIIQDVEAAVPIVDELVDIGGKMWHLHEEALERKQERKVQNVKDKIEMIHDGIDAAKDIADKVPAALDAVENAKDATVHFAVNFSPMLTKKIKDYLGKDHGSKVKQGSFAECSITNFADKACIFDEANNRSIFLISDNVYSCRFIKEKFRPSKLKTYYYYEIDFTDGDNKYNSYIRVSEKYRKCLEKYVAITTD